MKSINELSTDLYNQQSSEWKLAFERAYKAAKNKDTNFLKPEDIQLLEKNLSNRSLANNPLAYSLSPFSNLAAEGDFDAFEFLFDKLSIQHITKLHFSAIWALARHGRKAQVEAFSERVEKSRGCWLNPRGAIENVAKRGYAIGGYKVAALNYGYQDEARGIDLRTFSIEALHSLAFSDNFSKEDYKSYEPSDDEKRAVFMGYVQRGNLEKVEKTWEMWIDDEDRLYVYACLGHVQDVDQLLVKIGRESLKFSMSDIDKSGSNNYPLPHPSLTIQKAKQEAICGYTEGGYVNEAKHLKKFSPQVKYFVEENLQTTLKKHIQDLENYGQILGDTPKGINARILATNIHKEVDALLNQTLTPYDMGFARNNTKQVRKISKTLRRLIKNGKKTMREDRKLTDILAHIAIALTGIGLVIMIKRKHDSGSFFLNSTKREKMLGEIEKDIKLIK